MDHPNNELRTLTSTVKTASNLPVDQAQGVDVGAFEGIKVSCVDSFIQNLWSHVPVRREKNHVGPMWTNKMFYNEGFCYDTWTFWKNLKVFFNM